MKKMNIDKAIDVLNEAGLAVKPTKNREIFFFGEHDELRDSSLSYCDSAAWEIIPEDYKDEVESDSITLRGGSNLVLVIANDENVEAYDWKALKLDLNKAFKKSLKNDGYIEDRTTLQFEYDPDIEGKSLTTFEEYMKWVEDRIVDSYVDCDSAEGMAILDVNTGKRLIGSLRFYEISEEDAEDLASEYED